MKHSSVYRLGVVGWLVAAVAVAWAVIVCFESSGRPSEAHVKDVAASVRETPREKAHPRADPGAQEPDSSALADERDAVSIYARLGKNVKPETAALASRIRDAYVGKDFDALMACLDEAVCCESPVVRAMMASSLGYYARHTSLPEDDDDTHMSLETIGMSMSGPYWLRLSDEDRMRMKSVLPAVSLFLNDANASVRKLAAKSWVIGALRMDAGAERLDGVRDFFSKGNADVLAEFGQMPPYELQGFCSLENDARAEWCNVLAEAIERPINGEYENLARQMYSSLMNVEYTDRAGMAKTLEWEASLKRFAEDRYSDSKDVHDLVNFAVLASSPQHKRAIEIFEEVNSEYKTSYAALAAAMEIANAETVVAEKYGDSEDGKAVLDQAVSESTARWQKQDEEMAAHRARQQ